MSRIHLLRICTISLLILGLLPSAEAQVADSVSIPSIPAKLYWANKPNSYVVKGNNILIVAGAKTDMFRDPNVTYNTDNAPKLLFQPAENFVLSTSIQHGFVHKWDGGAIVLMEDSLHWIKFCFEKDYTGAHRVVSVVTNNISDDCNSIAVPGTTAHFKIAKADNVITLYASTDGIKWLLVRHLQFNATKPLRLGFLAQSPTGNMCAVDFSNIRYEVKKIKDPYVGE